MAHPVSLLITDLDNTLFDWVAVWHASFSTLLHGISAISEVPIEVLIPEIQQIHQFHGTSEYAFLIEEIPSLRTKYGTVDLLEVFAAPIEAFREARRSALKLYPGVMETITTIRNSGCLIVGYTESMAFYTNYRMRRLDLDLMLDFLFSPPDHDLPAGVTPDQIRHYQPTNYTSRHTIHRETPKGEIKPNPALLLDIVAEVGGSISNTLYVGDSLMKDVAMAQRATVRDVWAKYGTAQSRPEYSLLRAVTHWSPDQVEYERKLTQQQVRPTHTLERSFSQLLDLFEFAQFQRAPERTAEPSEP
jgi:FMN phosphatase YigB (HAD superfamily)